MLLREDRLATKRRVVPGGGYLVRADDLRLIYLALGVFIAPPLQRFRGSELPDLYAELCKHHSLERCEVHGDEWAAFSTEGVNHFELRRDRFRITEQVQRGFDIVKKDFADITEITQKKFNIQIFGEPRITLRALWPLPQNKSAAECLRENAIGLKDDQFELLDNAEVDNVGLKLNADTEKGHFTLEITPYWRDETQLFIEMSDHQHEVIQTSAVIEQRLQDTYDYFTKTVVKFVESFMP